MDNNKELLKKLFKIAENQQKIIRKLAQQQSDEVVNKTKEVNEAIVMAKKDNINIMPNIVCTNALYYVQSKIIKVEITVPIIGDPNNEKMVKEPLRKILSPQYGKVEFILTSKT